MTPLPIIPPIKRVPPTHGVAQRVRARSDPRRVVAVVNGAFVDAVVERAEYALDGGGYAVYVHVGVVAQLAEAERCVAVSDAVQGVVGGRAVTEEGGLGAVCGAEEGGGCERCGGGCG